jgi:hypothetical protein
MTCPSAKLTSDLGPFTLETHSITRDFVCAHSVALFLASAILAPILSWSFLVCFLYVACNTLIYGTSMFVLRPGREVPGQGIGAMNGQHELVGEHREQQIQFYPPIHLFPFLQPSFQLSYSDLPALHLLV